MKPRSWLVVSLLGNGVLVWMVIRLHFVTRFDTHLAPGPIVESRESKQSRPNASGPQFHWSQIESTDFRKYITNLTHVGCPQQTIVDIITAEVNQLYRLKATNLLDAVLSTNRYEFWRTSGRHPSNSQKPLQPYLRQLESLDVERRQLLSELLNVQLPADTSWAGTIPSEDIARQSLNHIAEGKRGAVKRLMDEFNAKFPEALAARSSAELDKLRRELNAGINELLTPDEMLQHDLKTSPLAQTLRRELDGFNPTEEEFLAIFQARKELSGDRAAKRIKEILGELRFERYQQAQDPAFATLSAFADRQGVPDDIVQQVYRIKSFAEGQAAAVRQNSSLDYQARQTALASIRSETEREIANIIGPLTWQAYQAQTGFGWLRRLGAVTVPGQNGPTTQPQSTFVPAAK